MAGQFKFKNYAVDTSTVDVEVMGVPFKLRRRLTIGEQQRVTEKGMKISLDATGKPTLEGIDNSELVIGVLSIAIQKWPFTDDNDDPTPITRQNIAQLDPSLLAAVYEKVMGVVGVSTDTGPLGTKSAEA